MRIAAIVFDLDGTLYAESRFALSGYAAVAEHVQRTGGAPAGVVFAALVGALRTGRRAFAFQDAARALGAGEDVVGEWLAVYRAHRPRLRLPRVTAETMARLRPGRRLGILTNGLPSVQRAKVDALGLDRLVDAIVYAEEHGTRTGKPDPSAFCEVLARLEAPAEASVFVGDDPLADAAGARACGMRSVLVTRYGRAAGARTAGADATLETLADLPSVIERWTTEVERAH